MLGGDSTGLFLSELLRIYKVNRATGLDGLYQILAVPLPICITLKRILKFSKL